MPGARGTAIACRCLPRVQTATIWLPGSRSTFFTYAGERENTLGATAEDGKPRSGLPGTAMALRAASLSTRRQASLAASPQCAGGPTWTLAPSGMAGRTLIC
ncbi:hypothetical protein ACFV80_16285 [Streptomyces sp. NPDC059862]|uniref:hypothetical protein n=1 Tax=Streptomyces sp. NPDC059862 TaxID=3346975 RepID=UPI003658678F